MSVFPLTIEPQNLVGSEVRAIGCRNAVRAYAEAIRHQFPQESIMLHDAASWAELQSHNIERGLEDES